MLMVWLQTSQAVLMSRMLTQGSSFYGNAMHAVRTQCKVLDVGQYSNPSFGPF